jgi:hypothetical protein
LTWSVAGGPWSKTAVSVAVLPGDATNVAGVQVIARGAGTVNVIVPFGPPGCSEAVTPAALNVASVFICAKIPDAIVTAESPVFGTVNVRLN